MSEPDNIRSINKMPLVTVLLIGTIIAILNQTLLTTAIPHIMSELNIDESTAQWLSSVFMLVNGIMIPITAFLIGTFTTRNLFLSAMGLFLLGTIIAIVSPNFFVLLIGRIVQASGAGILMPLMQTILLIIYPVEKRGQIMGTVGLVIAFAPAIGPTLSGYIVDHYQWKTVFHILLYVGMADILAAWFILKNVTQQTFPKVDILSIILSTLGFGGILYGFSIAGSSGWISFQVLISIPLGILALIWFILRQLKLESPILELRVFKYPIFSLSVIISTIAFSTMIASEMLLPIYMQNMLGFKAMKSGLVLLPGAIIMGLLSPITGRVFDKIGARWLTICGMSIIIITTFFFTQMSIDTTFTYLTVVYGIRMVGMAMVLMPITTAGLNRLSLKLIPHGTALVNTIRQVGASIGTAVFVTIMVTTASIDESPNAISNGIHGVNTAFWAATGLCILALVLSLFVKDTK